MNEVKQVGIWLRVSTEDQVKGESLEVHEARARSYADSKGWNVAEVYRLEAVSGKRVIDHPESKRMLADIKRGHITGLIFSKLARLSRNNRELLEFAESFQAAGADLISLAESIDTSTPAGRMFYNMLAAMASWEREEIAARVQASVPIRAAMGRPMGGQAQYGYKWEDKKFVLVPEEAAVRKLMYELFLEHRRFRTVARILNERSYRTRHGAKWAGSTIERLMRDPTAMGQKRYNYTKQIAEGRAWVAKPESEWVHHPCEPIVTPELWHAVNDLLTEKKLSGVRVSRTAKTLFGGLARCQCGGKMYVPSNMHKYVCDRKECRRKIAIDTLEAIWESEIEAFASSPETADQQAARIKTAISETGLLITANESRTREIDRQIDSLLSLYQSKTLDEADFKKRYTPLREQMVALEAELPRLREQERKLTLAISRGADALHEARHIRDRYPLMDMAERRRIVETVVECLIVGDDEVTFEYLFDPKI
ncbi:MAG: recombinase family protein [Sphingomonadales bacterium]|nr:recombinase family protein [Sphingomonadales bacterium]